MTKTLKLILIVCAQVFIIFLVVVSRYSILAGGTDVLLRIQPVDPRDPLRGDYVTFRLDVSNVYTYNEGIRYGDTVYVPIRKSGKFWTTTGQVMKEPPASLGTSGSESMYLRGVVVSGDRGVESPFVADTLSTRDGSRSATWENMRIEYGIEQYFIEEGKGRTFNFGQHEAYARVAVTPDGRAALRQIYIDDKPWP